jgi:hypothetical protein
VGERSGRECVWERKINRRREEGEEGSEVVQST